MLGSTGSLANSLNDSGECKEKCKSSWDFLSQVWREEPESYFENRPPLLPTRIYEGILLGVPTQGITETGSATGGFRSHPSRQPKVGGMGSKYGSKGLGFRV